MSELSRRNFLFASTGAAAGAFVVPGIAEAEEQSVMSQSGLVTRQQKPMKYQSIAGFLSAEQLKPHFNAHYGGALRGYLSADERLQSSIGDSKTFDASAYGALQRARTSKGNSVLLHELYFDGMVAKAAAPSPELLSAINKRFGSLDRWAQDFVEAAKSAVGWAMLTYHPVNGKLYNVVSDEHAIGLLWMSTPIVAIDVYEHAFYIDYHNRKADYINKFIDHIDWQESSRRFDAVS